ncbi:MAG: glycosyltransferase [Methylotenera sp.]|uniref:O-linked N-acetylglucosamine transferase, SPINDLY family protein n=1 Tax=Methylotenera sp. TaxID=2051956 RepID=UPI000D442D2A|nr:glycosyltransferase [Methylotenera sp.]PPC81869.1 MAG: glycosyltransferase [Methylotenera sp.]
MSTSIKNFDQLYKAGIEAEANREYLLALSNYSSALTLTTSTNQALLWHKIGMVYLQIEKYYQAFENLSFALTLNPKNTETMHGLAVANFFLGNFEDSCKYIDEACKLVPNNHIYAIDRASIRSVYNPDPHYKFTLYREWGRRFADPLEIKNRPFNYDPSPDRKLRIGYVSGDMRDHAVAFFMEPVFANHDKNKVEVHIYSNSQVNDAVTARLKKLVPYWHDVTKITDEALYELIRSHKIDVLVDLSGHTKGQRLFVFARRAAPVQVTWLGYMGGTLGMQAMDYRITDFGTDPVGKEEFYVETLFRMRCMACYQPPADCEITPLPPMLSSGTPTLISLNGSRKITDEMLLLWGKILEQRKDAQLFIQVQENSDEDCIATMEPRLRKANLPLDRVILSPHVPLQEFMKRGSIADVALDTHPVSGGTTTLHTLWMGLPIVTFRGHDSVSSTTSATLTEFGLEKWVADNDDEYIQHVLALLNNLETLIEHRKNIRNMMQNSLLMNYKEQYQELEGLYQRMWLNYLLGEKRFVTSLAPCEDVIGLLKNNAHK